MFQKILKSAAMYNEKLLALKKLRILLLTGIMIIKIRNRPLFC